MKSQPWFDPIRVCALFCCALLTINVRGSAPERLPRDLPLPASSPNRAQWLREASILQPYAHSQFTALADPGDRPARLKSEFGFNTIIVLPPDAHNVVPEKNDHVADYLTEERFRAGVAAYRAAGYRLILYTSVMACGIAPEFQSGKIAREHPDWAQRDPKGNPVLVYGLPWLCPSTGAREAALARAVRIAREYQADGIMLDNNEFFFAQAGWTCHCGDCTRGFRAYVNDRFGASEAKRLFGMTPDQLQIPTAEGPLFALWMNWRNRVWAGINESFRARLRKVNPKILFLANTQYAYDDGMLGTDFQYEREDALISESVGLSSRQMSAKMVLGHALADGRPLWNYIGTFIKADDYTGMRPAEVVTPLIAATLAHGARPWIVDGFDQGPTNAAAQSEMSRLLGWQASHEDLYSGERWAGVGTLISTTARNVLHRALIPPHLAALQATGTPVIALREENISAGKLRSFQLLTVETAPCLPDESARIIAKWVREGGMLVAAPDTGTYDELGRRLSNSTLWRALDLDVAPSEWISVGRGKVISPQPDAFSKVALQLAQPFSFRIAPETGVEVVAYRIPKYLLLHLVSHQTAVAPVSIRLPSSFRPAKAMTAQLLIPGDRGVRTLPLYSEADAIAVALTNVPPYCVLKIPLR